MTTEEIHPTIAKLGNRKGELLRHLKAGYEAGPQSRPFDAGAAWARIVDLAQPVAALGKTANRKTSAKLVKSYRAIADAMKTARDAVTEASLDCRFGLFFEWLDLVPDERAPGAVRDLFPDKRVAVFNETVAMIEQLEQASRRAAEKTYRGAGAPASSAVPSWLVQLLGSLFRDATGAEPLPGKTRHFQPFVETFLQACGRKRDGTVVFKSIRKADLSATALEVARERWEELQAATSAVKRTSSPD